MRPWLCLIALTACGGDAPGASDGGSDASDSIATDVALCHPTVGGPCTDGDSCLESDHCGIGSHYLCTGGVWIDLAVTCPDKAPLTGKGCGKARVTPGSACAEGDGPCDYGCQHGGNVMLRAECVGGVWKTVGC